MTRVFHSFPEWQLSGVNTWSVNLIKAMQQMEEFDQSILFTGIPEEPQPHLDGIGVHYSFLNVSSPRRRRDEWKAFKSFLESNAPCIYIPQYDFHRSAAVPTLSPDVKVCAVVHSDEECYYDLVGRIGYACDAIVTVSSHLAQKVSRRFPGLASRVRFIPPGVPAIRSKATRTTGEGTLELAYCNRLAQYQKRIFDLPLVAAELKKLGVDFHLTVTGDGPDADELRRRFESAGVSGSVTMTGRIPDDELAAVLARSHAFLLVSDFEGLPSSMLEAMSAGCVPVVYEIASGVGDAIESARSGVLVPHGNYVAMAQAIDMLGRHRDRLSALSAGCVERYRQSFSIDSMAAAYRSLFQKLTVDGSRQARRDGRVRVPRDLTLRHRVLRRMGLTYKS